MGKFRQWHESTIHVTGWCKDGRIFFTIDGKKYTYDVDTIYHDQLRKLRPEEALNKLKDWIKAKFGFAQQIDPPPIQNPQNPPSPPSSPRQRTLF